MQTHQTDFSTRQWASIMLDKLGMPRKAHIVLQANEQQLQFYLKLIKLLGRDDREILDMLAYSGIY
jgi:hypothetical protein